MVDATDERTAAYLHWPSSQTPNAALLPGARHLALLERRSGSTVPEDYGIREVPIQPLQAFRYELAPTKRQASALGRAAGTARFACHWGLSVARDLFGKGLAVPSAPNLAEVGANALEEVAHVG